MVCISSMGWKLCHCLCLHFLKQFSSLWDSCVVYLVVTSPTSTQAVCPHGGLFCFIDASFKDEGLYRWNCGCHLELMWHSLQINFGFCLCVCAPPSCISFHWVLLCFFWNIKLNSSDPLLSLLSLFLLSFWSRSTTHFLFSPFPISCHLFFSSLLSIT